MKRYLFICLVFSCCLLVARGAVAKQDPLILENQDFTYDTKGTRDPFMPLVTKEGIYISGVGFESTDGVSLEGILWDPEGKNSQAILNGTIFQEGERIGDIKVLKIEQAKVYLMVGSKQICIEVVKRE